MRLFATAVVSMLVSGCASRPALSTGHSDRNALLGLVGDHVSKCFRDDSVFDPAFVLSFSDSSGKNWVFSHGTIAAPDSGTDTLPVAFAMCTDGAASTAYAVKRYIEMTEDGHFAWASVDSRDIEAVALSLACSASRHAMQYNPLLGLLRPIPESAWTSFESMGSFLNEDPNPIIRQLDANPEVFPPESVVRIRELFSDSAIKTLRERLSDCEFGCCLLLADPWFLWKPSLHACLPVPTVIRESISTDLSQLGSFPEMALYVECNEGVVDSITLICFGIVEGRSATLEAEVIVHSRGDPKGDVEGSGEQAVQIAPGILLRPGHWLTSTWQ